MDDTTSPRPSAFERDDDVFDEADPHGGDDAAWSGDELAGAPPAAIEETPLAFWEGLVLGLLLSAAAWCLLLAVALAVYRLFVD